MYLFTHTYTYMYIYICMCVYINIYIYIYDSLQKCIFPNPLCDYPCARLVRALCAPCAPCPHAQGGVSLVRAPRCAQGHL